MGTIEILQAFGKAFEQVTNQQKTNDYESEQQTHQGHRVCL